MSEQSEEQTAHSTGGIDRNEYEVIVGFAGSSRTAAEVVEAKDRGEAGKKATDQYGCTAVVSEVFEL